MFFIFIYTYIHATSTNHADTQYSDFNELYIYIIRID
jgi:hypothetical protein